ncbi:MAG: type II secretion system protein GspN [Kofleriaceae bacterium]
MKRYLLVFAIACSSKPHDHLLHTTQTKTHLTIEGDAVPLADAVPASVKSDLVLPLAGTTDVAIDVDNIDRPAEMKGSLAITCTACQIGDDKTPLHIANPKTSEFGGDVSFGHLGFDKLTIAVDVDHGDAKIKTFEVRSPDVEIHVTGDVRFQANHDAELDLCVRFKPTEALKKRDEKMAVLLDMTGAPRAADGMYNIKIGGTASQMRRMGLVCDGSAPPPPAVDLSRPSLPAPSADEPPVSHEMDPATASALDAAIKSTSDAHYDVDIAAVKKIDLEALMKGARVVPAMKDGKADGFKLYAIKPGSLYEHLGFTNGDTISTVDGASLASADSALEAYQRVVGLAAGSKVEIVVIRKGAPVTITYSLK